ncbi:hypothetical protein [Hyphomicrobium sulfonivorans]|uniref:hypothetical protein n=1 Tax=Hyphomicrobium sulfonivorans TaxID=121290 RepID=UPI00156FFCE4|nr:hypothetical protein [Hyphomicrobium sulfonivorans]MBI1648874.1 hypothetical protein [Hyphomicrobium sulfonivorans]NSL70590.1 hypothetical protein [Hyphomicrobium sulfonivorans]
MAQTQVQFTSVQVLQAAKRAEAEGKMDYALQFYRHLVEQHGNTPEAQEAREGLFRIAEWRWGEARVTHGRDGGGESASAQSGDAAPASEHGHNQRSERAQTPPAPPPVRQHGHNNRANPANDTSADFRSEAAAATLPQIVSRRRNEAEGEVDYFEERFRLARIVAHTLSAVGWMMIAAGVVGFVGGVADLVAELAMPALLGLPIGVLVGVPTAVFGLCFVVAGQIAVAIFDSTNAALETAAMERAPKGY